MKMRKGFRRVLSLMMTFLMMLSLITVSGSSEKNVVKAAGNEFDAASQINFSTALGRAVDFGLTAGKITQNGHMETTIATNLFKNGGANNDVDLAGDSPAHFIIGGLDEDSKIILGKTYNDGPMIYNVETTTEIAKKGGDGKYINILPDNNCKADIIVKTESETTIKNNINKMIKHAKDESDAMLTKATLNLKDSTVMDDTHPPHVYIDLTDEKYDGKAVYINANDNDVLLAALQNTGQLHIKKRSNTVMVFNVKGFAGTQLNLNKYFVQVLQEDGTLGDEISSGDQTYSGNDSTHNQDIDSEIAQKIIWNVPDATNVRIDNTAGTFLIMNDDAFVSVGSSAGWCISPGEISTHGEWHYIYHGRSNDVNSNEKFDKEMHFAARKAFTESIAFDKVKEIKTQSLTEGQYTFDFFETDSDYKTDGKIPKFTQGNDANSKIKFGILSFSDADFGSATEIVKHYVIKEEDAGVYSNGVRNTTGEVDIELTVKKKTDGGLSFFVKAFYYLTKEDKAANKPYKTHANSDNSPIEMSDVEFSLGAFFNEVTDAVGTLRVKKQVKGDLPAATANAKEFKVSVKNGENKYVKLDGSVTNVNPGLTFKNGETLEFKNLPYGKYTIAEDTTDENINEPGYNLSVSGSNNETVNINSDTIVAKTITNTYTKLTPVSVKIKKTGVDKDDNTIADGLAGAEFSVSKDGVIVPSMGWTSGTDVHTLTFEEEGTYIIHEEKAPNEYKVTDDIVINVKKVGSVLKAYDSDNKQIDTAGVIVAKDEKMVPNRIGSITIDKTITGDGDASDLLKKLEEKGTYFLIKCTGQTGGTSKVGQYLKIVDGATITEGPGAPYTGEKVGEFTSNEAEAKIPLKAATFKKSADGKYSLTISRIIVEEGATYTYEVTEYDSAEDTGAYTWTVAPATGKTSVSLSGSATNTTAAFTNTYTEKKGYLAVTKKLETDGVMDAAASMGNKWFYFTITNEAGKYLDETGKVYSEKKILKLNKDQVIKISNPVPAGEYTVTEIKKDTSKGIDTQIQYYTFDETNSVTMKKVNVTTTSTSTAPVTAELKNVYKQQKGELVVKKKAVNAPATMADHQYKIGIKDSDGYFMVVDTEYNASRAAEKGVPVYYSLKNTQSLAYKNLPVGLYTVIENVDDASIAEYNLTITGDNKADDGYLDYGEGHHYVVNGKTTNVTVVNTYKDIDTGSISVTKQLTIDDATIKSSKVFNFIITTENGKKAVLDDKGTLGDLASAKQFNIKDGQTIKVNNLPLGKYLVKEVESSLAIEGYTLNSSSQIQSAVITLAAKGDNIPATLINTYTKDVEKGSVSIVKAQAGDSAEIPADAKFPISISFNTAGKYTVAQGLTTVPTDFEADTAKTFYISKGEDKKIVISDVPVGVKYKVTENIPLTMPEYTNTEISDSVKGVDSPSSTDTGTIAKTGTTVTITNKRTITEEKGNLKITKTIKGDITDEDFTGLTFTVKKGTDVVGEYTLGKDFTLNAGVYEKTIEDLPVGTDYSVTESLHTKDGKTVTVKYTVTAGSGAPVNGSGETAGSVAVNKNETTTVAYENDYKYSDSGSIKLTKTFDGEITDLTDAVKNGITFTVKKGSKKIGDYTLADFTPNAGVYEKTIEGLPTGTDYSVTESLYSAEGKSVEVTYKVNSSEAVKGNSVTGVEVAKDTSTTVAFTNKYSNIAKGKLIITKTIEGDVTDADRDGLKFTVKKGNTLIGEYILGTHFTFDSVTHKYVMTLEGLDEGENYTVTESLYTFEGKKVAVTYNVNSGTEQKGDTAKNVSVTKDLANPTTVNFKDEYKDTGKLKLTKTIKGDITDEDFSGLKFTVKKGENVVGEYTLGKDFTKNSEGVYEKTIEGIEVGDDYTVTESLHTKVGKTVTVKYKINGTGEKADVATDAFSVNTGETTTVDYENDYKEIVEKGSLKLTKTIEGDITDEDFSGLTFTVMNDTKLVGTYKLGTDFTKNDVTGVYEKTITGLTVGTKYTVTESLHTRTGKTVTVKYKVTGGEEKAADSDVPKTEEFSIVKDETTVVDYKNVYTKVVEKGKLKLTKTIEGDITDEDFTGLTFTVKKGTEVIGTYKLGTDFTKNTETGVYEKTIDDLVVGADYTVIESLYTKTGKTVTVSYRINGVDEKNADTTDAFSIEKDTTTVVDYKDVYKKEESTSTEKGSLVVRKTFTGDSITDAQKKAVTFIVKKKDGTEVASFAYDKMNAMGDYTVEGLEPGDYTVTETQYDVTGMKVVVTYTTSTEKTGSVADVTVVANDTSRVNFNNAYTKIEESTTAATTEATTAVTTEKKTTEKETTEEDEDDAKGTLIITIYDEKTGSVVPGAKLKVTTPSGKTKSYTTNDKGQVKLTNTDAGTYKVVVTDVPEGYSVTENKSFEVKVKKKKVTEAKVRIDKDGEVTVTKKITKSSAKTGDTVPVKPIAAVLVAAIIGLFVLIRKRRNA